MDTSSIFQPFPVRLKEMKLPDKRDICVPVKALQIETVSVSNTPVMASSKINVDSEEKNNVTMQPSKMILQQVTSVTDDGKIHNSTFCKKWVSVCPDPNDVSQLDHVIRRPLPLDISGETSHGMTDITSISCQIENMKKLKNEKAPPTTPHVKQKPKHETKGYVMTEMTTTM